MIKLTFQIKNFLDFLLHAENPKVNRFFIIFRKQEKKYSELL
jgi:hypothetical protein